MLFLILNIVATAALPLLFKTFEQRRIPLFQTIVFNYCTAAICGFIFLPEKHDVISGTFITQGWLPIAIILGMSFIVIFNLTSITTVRFGVSTAGVASKLGLVFPVLLAFIYYHEKFNWLQLVGILLAFVAVVLSSLRDKLNIESSKTSKLFFLPYIVFVGYGCCDCVTQFANKRYLMHTGTEEFVLFIFISASITGLAVLAARLLLGKTQLYPKSIIAGIIMGVPNYLSLVFLLKALATLNWGSSVIFPVSNLGAVAFSTAGGLMIFNEKLSKVNILGLVFAAIAITFITLSNYK